MLAETPVTWRSPCYSVVSASLINPFLIIRYLPHPLPHLRINTSLLQHFTADLVWEFKCLVEYRSALRKLYNKQRQVVSSSSSNCLLNSLLSLSLFSLSLFAFSILSLLPFLISPSFSTIPSISSDQFSVLR